MATRKPKPRRVAKKPLKSAQLKLPGVADQLIGATIGFQMGDDGKVKGWIPRDLEPATPLTVAEHDTIVENVSAMVRGIVRGALASVYAEHMLNLSDIKPDELKAQEQLLCDYIAEKLRESV